MSSPLLQQTDLEILIDNVATVAEDKERLRVSFAMEINGVLRDGRAAVELLGKIAPWVDEATKGEIDNFMKYLERR